MFNSAHEARSNVDKANMKVRPGRVKGEGQRKIWDGGNMSIETASSVIRINPTPELPVPGKGPSPQCVS